MPLPQNSMISNEGLADMTFHQRHSWKACTSSQNTSVCMVSPVKLKMCGESTVVPDENPWRHEIQDNSGTLPWLRALSYLYNQRPWVARARTHPVCPFSTTCSASCISEFRVLVMVCIISPPILVMCSTGLRLNCTVCHTARICPQK